MLSRLTARVCERPSRVDGGDLKLLGLDLENGSTCCRQGGDGKRAPFSGELGTENGTTAMDLVIRRS